MVVQQMYSTAIDRYTFVTQRTLSFVRPLPALQPSACIHGAWEPNLLAEVVGRFCRKSVPSMVRAGDLLRREWSQWSLQTYFVAAQVPFLFTCCICCEMIERFHTQGAE